MHACLTWVTACFTPITNEDNSAHLTQVAKLSLTWVTACFTLITNEDNSAHQVSPDTQAPKLALTHKRPSYP